MKNENHVCGCLTAEQQRMMEETIEIVYLCACASLCVYAKVRDGYVDLGSITFPFICIEQ